MSFLVSARISSLKAKTNLFNNANKYLKFTYLFKSKILNDFNFKLMNPMSDLYYLYLIFY